MKKVIILRYGEIHLKGKNRGYFENALIENIKHSISKYSYKFSHISGRYVVSDYEEKDEAKIINAIRRVFGLVSLSVAAEVDSLPEIIEDYCKNIIIDDAKTFRMTVARADKTFPIHSSDYEKLLGGCVLDNNPDLKVSLKNPEKEIIVEIRENKKTYILTKKIACAGGMPVGTSGRGLLMLSGGIDSPVAGYLMAKRGMSLSAIHFHSFPYTSLQAKEKVNSLKEQLEKYAGRIKLYVVPFTRIQEEIHKNCKPEYMITIMRRIMMRISEKICRHHKLSAIITGESLGQVASQTIEGITSSNSVLTNIPVLRPLIGFDKCDIVKISEEIETFETSILPYEDCCTVFLPKNPIIKPKLDNVKREEEALDINSLIDDALSNIEIIG